MSNSSLLEFQSFDLESKDTETLIDLGRPAQKRSASPDLEREAPIKSTSSSFWTFEYYQQFFDVNTDEVLDRLIWSMVPSFRKNFLDSYIKPNPDLYGPIWVATTLIFTLAVTGNIGKYMTEASSENHPWQYDFHLLSYAASAIFSYVCLVPVALWIFMKWNNNSDIPISFLELLCTYGYSVSVYVPAAVLSTVQWSWFQWSVILLAATVSAIVLVSAILPTVSGPKKFPIAAVMVSLHYLLAIGLAIYFLNAPDYFTHAPQDAHEPALLSATPVNASLAHQPNGTIPAQPAHSASVLKPNAISEANH